MPPRRLRSRLLAWALRSRAASGHPGHSRVRLGRLLRSRAASGRPGRSRATIGYPMGCRARSVRSEAQNWRNVARQPPSVHALPGNTIGIGAELSQEETQHKCSCQFWELLFRASANTQASTQQNPRIARGHHALTGTRPNRYSHYWNERISGVGGARGLPPIDILELIRRKRERDREALTLHRIGQDPNAHLVAQPFNQIKTDSR